MYLEQLIIEMTNIQNRYNINGIENFKNDDIIFKQFIPPATANGLSRRA